MYAQLCKRLSEEAPNFEPPGQPCTFKLLLLNKCRTEFENRAQAFAAFEDKVLSPDEEEKRHLAKCKMLGNIKFIGELGKLEILAESILHRCIQNLLARRAAAEHHEDLECLAQLVRTCGRVLDSERGRGLMDQYFARIETLSLSHELAPRIRFMLRDVVELRRGGWVPRAAVTAEGPVPMHQLRGDDEPPRRERDRERDREREPLFRRARPLDDVLAGLALQPAAALVPPGDKLFGNGFARDAFRQRSAPGYFPRQPAHYKPAGGKEPAGGGAGRAGKARVYAVGAAALSDLQMRPAANSLMFTANRLSRPPPQLQPVQPNVLAPAFASAPPMMKEPAITIKPAPDKKDKPKKDKGVNKEEACRLAVEAAEALAGDVADGRRPPDTDAEPPPLRRLQDLQLPDKVLRRVISSVLEHALAGAVGASEAEAEAELAGAGGARAWAACCVVRAVKRAPLGDALRALCHSAGAAGGARVRLRALLAHAVRARLVTLAEVGAWCEGGAHHPLLLDVLQELRHLLGVERLHRLYDESKVGAERACGPSASRTFRQARPIGDNKPERVRVLRGRQRAGVGGRGRRRRRRAGGAGGARPGRARAAAARAGAAAAPAGRRARAAGAVPLDQEQRGAGRAQQRGVRVDAGGAGGAPRDGRGRVAGRGRRQGGAGAREGAGGGVRAAADGAAQPARPAAGRRLRRAGARAPPPVPQGYAPALVHVPVQPGGVRGGRLPALARGRHRRLPREGRSTIPGEHVADVAAAAGVGGRGGGGLDAAAAAARCPRAAPLLFRAHLI